MTDTLTATLTASYDISLRIRYDYTTPAAGGRHLVRLLPITRAGSQRLVAGHIDIGPDLNERTESVDFFGNHTVAFALTGHHDHISLKLTARVDRAAQPPAGRSVGIMDLGPALASVRALDGLSPLHFRAASPRVPLNDTITDYGRSLVVPGQTVTELVETLGQALHHDMRYDPEATEVDTPAAEAFEKRHGVCQDFSHIMIASLRGLGIPSGYVSGFLRTIPPPGKPRLEGADAMHAWVRAWCGPEAGWVDYDPTNATFAGQDHIEVAFGRDYSDVAPIKGMMRGASGQRSLQEVDVVPR